MPVQPVQRSVTVAAVIVAAALSLLPARTARAIGVYEDAAGNAGFLFAPHRPQIRAAIIRADGDLRDASVFLLSGAYPLRDYLLVQIEQPYIALIDESDIASGFGDLRLRGRLRLAGSDGRALHLLGGLRVGSGSRRYFPYSSQSYDMELGVGYVDSLNIAHVWVSAAGVAVKREPEGLPVEQRHQNFARFDAGVALPFGNALTARVGATGLVFRSGSVRDLYFAQLQYRRSPSVELRVSAHVEAGESVERVSDLALTAAIVSSF